MKKKLLIIFTIFCLSLGVFTACDNSSQPLETEAPIDTSAPGDTSEPEGTNAPVIPTATLSDFVLTSHELVGNITVGWNLGNTLDAYNSGNAAMPLQVDMNSMLQVETAWIAGVANHTTPELIARVKEAGFNAVRIPTTWYKMAGGAPDYIIRSEWMDHVQKIVDMVVAEDMYVILNTHHEEYILRLNDEEERAAAEEAITALWTQIATRFKNYGEKLIFEGLNEPRHRKNEWDKQGNWDWNGSVFARETVNILNQAFVNAVRGTGGNNEKRHLMIATYGAQTYDNPLNSYKLPEDPITENGTDKFIMSVHVYSPHRWAHDGKGEYEGAELIQLDLERVAAKAVEIGVPVILGEFGTVARLEHELRVRHGHDYIRIATEMRERAENPVIMASFWWDDHGNFRLVSRQNPIDERGTEIISAMMKARQGLPFE